MTAFDYQNCPYPVSDDKQLAHREAWQKIAGPGNWWSGAQRVAIVQAARDATACQLCKARKGALSPFDIAGQHGGHVDLPDVATDAAHRITTDPSRLTGAWIASIVDEVFTYGHYVELLGVVVAALSIDTVHRALGLPQAPLPAPVPGKPDGYLPPGAAVDVAWVPMLTPQTLTEREQDIFLGAPATANVIRALSLVPDAVRLLHSLAAAHYVPTNLVRDFSSTGGLNLSRPQIELIASRTSALNDCFY